MLRIPIINLLIWVYLPIGFVCEILTALALCRLGKGPAKPVESGLDIAAGPLLWEI